MSPEMLAMAPTQLAAGHAGWMWAGAIVMIVLWAILITSAAWLVATRPGHGPVVPTDRAREILAERYARGEISADEYSDRLHVLDDHVDESQLTLTKQ